MLRDYDTNGASQVKITTAAQSFCVTLFLSLFLTNPANAQRFIGPLHKQTVKFQRGKSSAIIRGVAHTPGTYEYTIGGVQAGQAMVVSVASENQGVEASIETPEGGWAPNGLGVKTWIGRASTSGNYKVILTNNASKYGRHPKFTLKVIVGSDSVVRAQLSEPLLRARKAAQTFIFAARAKNWKKVHSLLAEKYSTKPSSAFREVKDREKEFRYFQVGTARYDLSENNVYGSGSSLDTIYVTITSSRSPGWSPLFVLDAETYQVQGFYFNDD